MLVGVFIGYILLSRQSEESKGEITKNTAGTSDPDEIIQDLRSVLSRLQTFQTSDDSVKTSGKRQSEFSDDKRTESGPIKILESAQDENLPEKITSEESLAKTLPEAGSQKCKSVCLNHLDVFDKEHKCSICKNKDIKMKVDKSKGVFEFKFLTSHFFDLNDSDKYYLCIIRLPSYEMMRLHVTVTIQKFGNFTYVGIQSPLFIEYMIDSNCFMFFEKKDEKKYVRKSKILHFRKTQEPDNATSNCFCFKKVNTKYFDDDTSKQEGRQPFTKMPKMKVCNKNRQYAIGHKLRGMFVCDSSNNSVLSLYMFNIPFLLCSSNLPLLELYKQIYLEKVKDLPEDSRSLLISLYDDILVNKESSIQERVIEISIGLYNILIDFINRTAVYKKCTFFSGISQDDMKKMKKFVDEETEEPRFLKYLENYSDQGINTLMDLNDYYGFLCTIFSCLFDKEKLSKTVAIKKKTISLKKDN